MNNPGIWLSANWPAPDWLCAGTSLRTCSINKIGDQTFNLATHVGDDEAQVSDNRQRLKRDLILPADPVWLEQVHGNRIINLDQRYPDLVADGAVTTRIGTVCAVLTADCVPLLLFDAERHTIAAIHVGWRGLSKQIIEAAMQYFTDNRIGIMAWIGPHICSRHYEIDAKVREACLRAGKDLESAFTPARPGHWYANLGLMIEKSLEYAGITNIYHNDECTFDSKDRFYSHRRDGTTGRMATLIWMCPEN